MRNDLRYAFRNLRNHPGYAAVAIVTIALAIGANTAMFSFIDGLLLNPLTYPDPDRIVRVLERRPDGGVNGISTLNYLDWAEQNTVFEHISAQTGYSATLTGADEPLQVSGIRVSPAYFDIIDARPLLGRTFTSNEDQLGQHYVVLLSYSFWQSQFGADPDVVGTNVVLDGEPHTVVGVLPADSTFDRMSAQVWKPLAFEPSNMTRNFHWFGAFAKLRAGVSLEQAQAEMDVIGERIAQAYPDSNKDWGVAVDPLADVIVGDDLRTAVVVLFAATGFVLLIGCANLASFALARGVSREREIAVRSAIGAGRWRLVRQLLTESVVLAVLGGVVGIAVAFAAMRGIVAMIPPYTLPAEVSIGMDTNVLLFALGAAVITGLLFGLAPALQATHVSLAAAMKDGGHGATPGSGGRTARNVLVVAEVALAFVLLVGSGLLMRSLFSLLEVDPGFDSTNVLTAGLPVDQSRYPDAAELNNYLDSVRTAVEAVPGVEATAITSALPLQGWGYGMPYQIAGRDLIDRANRSAVFFKMVTPGYFETLGIRLLSGRTLADTDVAGSPPVAVINNALAEREFPDEDPLGQRIMVQQIVPGQTALGDEIGWEVVGVIADEKVTSLNDDQSAGMYVTNWQSPIYNGDLIVRAALDPRLLEQEIKRTLAGVSADQALSDVRTLEQIERESMVGDRIQTTLFGIFAITALVLAAVGIYGVISYTVAQQTSEIGIRAALGANAGNIRRLVFRNGMRPVLIGIVTGLIGAVAVTRLMESMLFGVAARDPLTLAAVTAVLVVTAACACVVPAWRATRVDPLEALRYQ